MVKLLKGGPIRLGDKTTGGGDVISASGTTCNLFGRPVALQGDQATCPTHGGIQAFVEACYGRLYEGKGWVLQGHKLSCGCSAISSIAHCFMVEDTLPASGWAPGAAGAAAMTAAALQVEGYVRAPVVVTTSQYDEQFHVLSKSGNPLANAAYKIVSQSGAVFTGTTDARGKTSRVITAAAESLHIYLVR